MHLWRISNHRNLKGEGGRRYGARWHSAGHPIVYLAASPAGALVEVLVHLELDESDLPHRYILLRVTVPQRMRATLLRVPAGEKWKSDLAMTRDIGDDWLRSNRSALARVPSAILPNTFNYLLNPQHPDAAHILIEEVIPAVLDRRLQR